MVQALLKAGADVNCDINTQGAAWRKAAKSGDFETFTLLLMFGGALDAGERLCYTALQIAAMRRHLSVVEALIAADADVIAYRSPNR
jgi:ankyrin repeat protein